MAGLSQKTTDSSSSASKVADSTAGDDNSNKPLTQNDGNASDDSPMDQDGGSDSDDAAETNAPLPLGNVLASPVHKLSPKSILANPNRRETNPYVHKPEKRGFRFAPMNFPNNRIPPQPMMNLSGAAFDIDDRFCINKSAPGAAFELESDSSNLLSLDNFGGNFPLTAPSKDSIGNNDEPLFGPKQDSVNIPTVDSNNKVCNVNKSDATITSTSTEQLDKVEEDKVNKDEEDKEVTSKDDFKIGADSCDKKDADEKNVEENNTDKDEGSAETSPGDKSVIETVEKGATKSDDKDENEKVKESVERDKETVEDVEMIQNVKSARTVTRQSIPGKNASESGEIEIIKVDIINKPKRREEAKKKRRKGDKRGRRALSSDFESQSDEEGVIPERKREKVTKKKKKSKESTKHQGKDGDIKGGKKIGDSTAEEGEVKSDDERGSKKKKKKKKKNKDSRNVIMENPTKMLIPDLGKVGKVKLDTKKSDSESGKSRERGGYGDLRQVIQVKRDSHPDEDFRRFEWRRDERRVESATNQWEPIYSYGGYGFGESKKWENFTVQRDRSPVYDRRKEKEMNVAKRGGMEPRQAGRGGRERNRTSGSRDRFPRPVERETLAEKAIRLEREASKKERQLQDARRGEKHLTMAEREAMEMKKARMDEHIERKYGKQGFLTEIRRSETDAQKFNAARDKHGRERSYDQHDHRENPKDKIRESRLRDPNRAGKDQSRERKRSKRQASHGSRSRDEYSSDRHRSMDKRSYDSDMSRSSRSESSDKEEERGSNKELPKTSAVPKTAPSLPGQKTDGEVSKKKKKDKTKGKKDKKDKAAKKAAKKAKALKSSEPNNKEPVAPEPSAPAPVAKRPAESQSSNVLPEAPVAKKQKKIKVKKDKKKKKAAKLAKLAAKTGVAPVPAPRPTCLIQDDDDPDVIDLTGEVENRSPSPSTTPPTPAKPATPTKPPPKDPSPIVSSTADIRNNLSSSLYDPFEPTASPPISYSNSASPMSSADGNTVERRKDPSSISSMRVSRGSADREKEVRIS